MFLILLLTLVTFTTAGTVWLAGLRPRQENDPDAAFWYGFAGCAVVIPIILIPAMSVPLNSGILALAATATAVVTVRQVRRRRTVIACAAHRADANAALEMLRGRQQTILNRWSNYELDPAQAIDFPAMNDVRVIETARLARCLARAHAQQSAAREAVDLQVGMDDAVCAYSEAVAELAAALATAERAAGCPAAVTGPPAPEPVSC